MKLQDLVITKWVNFLGSEVFPHIFAIGEIQLRWQLVSIHLVKGESKEHKRTRLTFHSSKKDCAWSAEVPLCFLNSSRTNNVPTFLMSWGRFSWSLSKRLYKERTDLRLWWDIFTWSCCVYYVVRASRKFKIAESAKILKKAHLPLTWRLLWPSSSFTGGLWKNRSLQNRAIRSTTP